MEENEAIKKISFFNQKANVSDLQNTNLSEIEIELDSTRPITKDSYLPNKKLIGRNNISDIIDASNANTSSALIDEQPRPRAGRAGVPTQIKKPLPQLPTSEPTINVIEGVPRDVKTRPRAGSRAGVPESTPINSKDHELIGGKALPKSTGRAGVPESSFNPVNQDSKSRLRSGKPEGLPELDKKDKRLSQNRYNIIITFFSSS